MRTGRRAKSPSIRKSIEHAKSCATPRHMKGVQGRIAQLKEIIEELNAKNSPLRARCQHLKELQSNPNASKLVLKDFRIDLNEHMKRIEKRQKQLNALEASVLIFRPEDRESDERWLQDQRAITRKRPVMPLPSLNDQKGKVTSESLYLRNKVLYYERLIILRKLQLKLCHDHRDLSVLRDRLEMITNGDYSETPESDMRSRCALLREMIEYEKDRIRLERAPFAEEYFAAITIQAAWRGYLARKKRQQK